MWKAVNKATCNFLSLEIVEQLDSGLGIDLLSIKSTGDSEMDVESSLSDLEDTPVERDRDLYTSVEGMFVSFMRHSKQFRENTWV